MLEGRTDEGGEAVEESLLVPAEGPLPPSPEQLPLPEETIELAVPATRKAHEAAELTPDGHEALEAIAAMIPRSEAGSSTNIPPATLTNTSSPPRWRPARFSRTASSRDSRCGSMPFTIRRALP
jgi:hypothetical protein